MAENTAANNGANGLVRLDAGLRSASPLDQLDQLLQFPQLLQRFPMPVIINTGFLKIADAYRSGSNDIRLQILRVLKQCTPHFELILNKEEVLLRFSKVLETNDPVARTITLRVLGVMAGLLRERIDLQQTYVCLAFTPPC